MTKAELVNWMAKEAGITKKGATTALNCFCESDSRFIEEEGR